MFIYLIIIAFVLGLDVFTKYLAVNMFRLSDVEIIKDVLYFTYVENRGAAFGIMQNKQWFFIIVTIVLVAVMIGFIIKKKPESKLLMVSLSFIIAGGIGNLIDRIRLGYVVDFIDFRIINYPVFNVADCFVVVGAILLCVYVLFSKDEVK